MSGDLLDEVQQLRRVAEQALSSTTTSASVPFPHAERPPLATPAPPPQQHRQDLPHSHGAENGRRGSNTTTGTTVGAAPATSDLNREIEAIASTGFSGVAHAQHSERQPSPMIDRPPSLHPPSTGTEQSRFDMAVPPLGFGNSRQPSTGGGDGDSPPELPYTSRSHSTQPHTPSPQRATFAQPTQSCDGRTDVSVFASDARGRPPTMNQSEMNHRLHGTIPIHSTHHESTQSPAARAGVYDGPLFPPETPPARPVALSAFAHSPAAPHAAALEGDRDFPTPAFQRAHQRPPPQSWTATASPDTRRHHTVVPDTSNASPSNSGPMLDGGLSAFGVPTPARPLEPRDVATGHTDHGVPRAGEHQPPPGAVAITAAGQRSIGCNTDDLPRKSIATATSPDLQSDSQNDKTRVLRDRRSVAAVAVQAEAAVLASAVQTIRLDTAVKSTECAILSHAELDAATTKIAELMEEIDSLRCASAQGTSQQERLTATVESLRADLATSQEQLRIEALERSRCEVELSDFKRKEEQNRSATAVEVASLRSALEKLQAENVTQRQATTALQGEKDDLLLMVDVLKRKANELFSSHLHEKITGGAAVQALAHDATASVSALRLECAELQGTVEALSVELTRTSAARDALHELVVSMSHDGDEYAAPPSASFSSSPYLLLENTGPHSRSQSPQPRTASPPAEPWHQSYPGHPYQRYRSSLSPSSSSAVVPRFSRDASSTAVTTSRQSSRERQQRGLSTAGASVSGVSVRSRSTQPTTARRRGSELSTSTQALGRRGDALMNDRSIHPHFTDPSSVGPKPDDTAGGGGVAFSADAVKGLSSADTAMMLQQCDRLLAM